MQPFEYSRAATFDEALDGAGAPGTRLLAGGTELLNWMRLGIAQPDRVVDISRLDELTGIGPLPGGGLRIGALTRLNDIAGDERVRRDWPVLRQAVDQAASAQLRNLATIGGNLLQKTRCAYFRSEDRDVPCNRRQPGSGCAALRGRSDRHAVFGWTEDCIATFPADPAAALAVLDADVVTGSAGGGRRIPIGELHLLPGERVDADTVLEPGEIIAAIEIAAPASHSAYVKVRERASYEYALVAAAASVELDDGRTIRQARIALGSVAMRPWRLEEAERRLTGLPADGPEIEEALDAALADARPVEQSAYKVPIARGAAHRALRTAIAGGST